MDVAKRTRREAMPGEDHLRTLLPAIEAPYNDLELDTQETEALQAALGDGFGDVGVIGNQPLPLPEGVETGLLKHSFYVRGTSEYDPVEFPDEFWDDDHPEGKPGPFEMVPLQFVIRRLKVYFENQRDRYAYRIFKEEEASGAAIDLRQLQFPMEANSYVLLGDLARYRLYEKPWYEFHALELIALIEDLFERSARQSKIGGLGLLILVGFAGTLGRLVEQYYWRLSFERAAITGQGAQRGASAGGHARAAFHRSVTAASWQRAAMDIWTRRPDLSKISVAKVVKRQLGDARSAKHIGALHQASLKRARRRLN
jgi:hypothetical protein